MPDPTPAAAAPVEVAPEPVLEAPAKPKADFRDVKVRRISQSDGTAPVKVDPPTYSIPSGFILGVGGIVLVHSSGVSTSNTGTDLFGSAITLTGGSTLNLSNGTTVVSSCIIGNGSCL